MTRLKALRLPQAHTRRDAVWETDESGKEHRDKVLRALKDDMVDLLVAKFTFGEQANDDPEFLDKFVGPLWDNLAASLTRADLLRWLIDWAQQAAEETAFQMIMRLQEDLDDPENLIFPPR